MDEEIEKPELLEIEEQKKVWLQELQENEAVQNYLKNFNEISTGSFLDIYVFYKYQWLQYGGMYEQINERERTRWITLAQEQLVMIQQKKLFDAQCLWRAEKVTFKEVEIGFDFEMWGKDVLNCPFIEPITESDIDLYSQYLLLSNNVDLEIDEHGLQNYDQIKEAYNTDSENMNFPEWYDFHNSRTGNTALMLLPDLRTEKEEFYRSLHFKKEQDSPEYKKMMEEHQQTAIDTRPYLHSFDHDTQKYFVTTFEDKQTQRFFKSYTKGVKKHNTYESEVLADNIDFLSSIENELIPIEGHYDFREAIALAVHKYKCKKIAEHLPVALEQYQLSKKMGFSIGHNESSLDWGDIREKFRDNIINGRILNGEPGDCNF